MGALLRRFRYNQPGSDPTESLPGWRIRDQEESVRKDKKRAIVCGHHMQNNSMFWGCPALAFLLYYYYSYYVFWRGMCLEWGGLTNWNNCHDALLCINVRC